MQTRFADLVTTLATQGIYLNDFRMGNPVNEHQSGFSVSQPANSYAVLAYKQELGFYINASGCKQHLAAADALAASARFFELSHLCDQLNTLLAEHDAQRSQQRDTTLPVVAKLGDYKAEVNHYVTLLQKRQDQEDAGMAFKSEYKVEFNRKYARVLKCFVGSSNSGSVWCFIDQAGNVYKPASSKAPAQGVRGTIYHPTDALTGTTHLGPHYNYR